MPSRRRLRLNRRRPPTAGPRQPRRTPAVVPDATDHRARHGPQAAAHLMATLTRRVINWAAAFEDGALIRAAFFGLLTRHRGHPLSRLFRPQRPRSPAADPGGLTPILPAFDPAAPGGKPGPQVDHADRHAAPTAERRAGLGRRAGAHRHHRSRAPPTASPPKSRRMASTSRPWRSTRRAAPSPTRSPSAGSSATRALRPRSRRARSAPRPARWSLPAAASGSRRRNRRSASTRSMPPLPTGIARSR